MISIPAASSSLKASPKVDNNTRAENLISLDTDLTVQTGLHNQQPSPTKAPNNNNPFLNMSPQLPQTPTNATAAVSGCNSTNPFKSTPPSNHSHTHSLPPTSLSAIQQSSYAAVVVGGNPFKGTNGSGDTAKIINNHLSKNQQQQQLSNDVVDAEKVSSGFDLILKT